MRTNAQPLRTRELRKIVQAGTVEGMIDAAVAMRESGETRKALAILEAASAAENNPNTRDHVLNAYAQRIVCHLRLYEDSRRRDNNQLVRAQLVAEQALRQIPAGARGNPKRRVVFNYRLGDIHYRRGDHAKAASYLGRAVRAVHRAEKCFPEYASYYGLALIATGKADQGLVMIANAMNKINALQAAEKKREEREGPSDKHYGMWHLLIIECGVMLKFVEAGILLRQREACVVGLARAKKVADKLARKYKMRLRQRDVTAMRARVVEAFTVQKFKKRR